VATLFREFNSSNFLSTIVYPTDSTSVTLKSGSSLPSGLALSDVVPAGVVSTIAGSGSYGFADGIGTAASFTSPYGIAIDSNGNLYVADSGNHKIRKINTAGIVSTLAGGEGGYDTNGYSIAGSTDGTG